MAENFRKTPYASLVREAIQNSLDVADPTTNLPVEVQFSIGSIDSRNFPRFFGIEKHIRGCIDNFPNNDKAQRVYPPMLAYLDSVNVPNGRLKYIRISDRNTVGMHYDNPEANDSPFYAFVRSAGVSSKSNAEAGGSYGFGKAAYFYLSPIRTILVSTLTDKRKHYFEGVASLCSHKINGQTVSNIVYYDNNGGEPVTDFNRIPSRFQRKDSSGVEYGPGTDIFIMGIDPGLCDEKKIDEKKIDETKIYEQMKTSVLENFWLAILRGKLVVKIGKGNTEVTIDSSNITQLMVDSYAADDPNRRKNYNPRPYFETVVKADKSDKYIRREVKLDSVKTLTDLDSTQSWGHVEYYFQKNRQAHNRIVYMRGLQMKVKITAAQPGEGYYGVIVCPDGLCNIVLRKSENPAHDEWDANRPDSACDKRLARELLKVIEEKKNEIISEIFNLDKIERIKIKDLATYLPLVDETTDDEDEDSGVSSVKGDPTGDFQNDGCSPTTDTEQIVEPKPTDTSGTAWTPLRGSADPSPDGKNRTGRGNTTTIRRGGRGSRGSRIQSPATPKGGDGYSLEPIEVKYRSFAQAVEGKIIHKLIIYSPRDVENAQVEFLVGGESSDSKIAIESVSRGVVNGNAIKKLPLVAGRNKAVDIVFADNQPHSVKLNAYALIKNQ